MIMNNSLIDELNARITDITKVRQREVAHDNKEKQKTIDKRFSSVVSSASELVDTLAFAKKSFQFQLEHPDFLLLINLYNDLPNVVVNNVAKSDLVAACITALDEIIKLTKNSWELFYPSYVSETRNTLMIIRELDNKSEQCLKQIDQGREFEKKHLESLFKGMKDASDLIDGLKMDADIKHFLQLMNSGQASLLSLDAKVLQWLRDENLEGKIKLTFSI